MEIRAEMQSDAPVISALIDEAFAGAEHSDGTEAAIVEQLRDAGALTLSLVAAECGEVTGHVALSPVTIDGEDQHWLGVGPVAVLPNRQRHGIGERLVREALIWAEAHGAAGCVVLGEPSYYRRFGFRADPRLRYPGPPPEYFQALAFGDEVPTGTVAYHPAFGG